MGPRNLTDRGGLATATATAASAERPVRRRDDHPVKPFFDRIDTSAATGGGNEPLVGKTNGCTGDVTIHVGKTVWYEYTPKLNQQIRIDTFGSSYNTIVFVYTGDKGSLSLLACNDDKTDGSHSLSKLNVNKGETYYIMVGAFFNDGGELVFQLAPTRPSFSLLLDGVDAADCNTLLQEKKCRVAPGNKFTVSVILDGIGNLPDTNNNGVNGYTTINARLDYSWNLVLQGSVDVAPGCFAPGIAELNFSVKYQCFANGGESEATTPVLEATFRCPDFKSKETITLVHGQIGDSIIGISGTYLKDDGSTTAGPAHFEFGPAETIVINCDNYYPWDVHGPNQSTDLDGIVDLPNDILGVIQHFCPLPTQPCSKANLGN